MKETKVAMMAGLIALTLLILPGITPMGVGMPDPAWARTYGGTGDDLVLSVEQTSDGGFVVAGGTKSFGSGEEDVWVLRLDSGGNVVWEKSYGPGEGRSVKQTSEGGFIVAGFTGTFTPVADAFVFKLDPSGGVIWSMTYGGGDRGDDFDAAFSVQQTSDGGYLVGGSTRSFAVGIEDAWILRLDSSGNVVWTKTYGGGACNIAYSAQQTSDGAFIFAGRRDSGGCVHEGPDAWVVRLNADGTIAWEETFGAPGVSDHGFSVQQTSDGGFIVAGETEAFGGFLASDFWVLRLDGSGGVVWQKTYGGTGHDLGFSVQQTLDGGFIVAGMTSSFGAGDFDYWVLRLDSIGNVVWEKTYGGSGNDAAFSVRQTSDGGFVVAGFTGSFGAGGLEAMVLRLNAGGEISSECPLMGVSTATVRNTDFVATASNPTVTSPSTTGTVTSPTVTDTSATTESQCEETPATEEVSIDIKPGSFPNSINPGSSGTIPVAILSTTSFDAPSQVDRPSLTFGRTGNEQSLAFCSPSPEDVNGDGLLDLVCHFNTGITGFWTGDTQGILRGRLTDNTPIEGSDSVRILAGGGGRASSL